MRAELQGYFHALARRLRLEPRKEREIILELEAHLEDRARELQEEGLTPEEAYSRAIQELGRPEAIARDMYTIHSRGSWWDIFMATLPHLLLALLFALHLWTRFIWVVLLLVGVTFVSLRGWRAGRPKWTYPWLGYCMAAPAVSWLMALVALGYGVWIFLNTGALPFSLPIFLLILAYIPFSLWIIVRVVIRVVRQDWLLASLTALPFPFLTSWLFFLDWKGGLWASKAVGLKEADGDRALVFLALAVTTAVFLKVGPRLLKISLLSVATGVLVAFNFVSLPVNLSLLAIILLTIASVAFLLSPALLDSRVGRGRGYSPFEGNGGVVTHWFTSAELP
jgi:hypothetical protein